MHLETMGMEGVFISLALPHVLPLTPNERRQPFTPRWSQVGVYAAMQAPIERSVRLACTADACPRHAKTLRFYAIRSESIESANGRVALSAKMVALRRAGEFGHMSSEPRGMSESCGDTD